MSTPILTYPFKKNLKNQIDKIILFNRQTIKLKIIIKIFRFRPNQKLTTVFLLSEVDVFGSGSYNITITNMSLS
jgi:hypothetical protein